MVVEEERERRGWKNRHMRDNIPCIEASAVKLTPDHTSKLDAVLVDPCSIQCLLAKMEEKEEREEKEREEKERREEGKKREEKGRERESPRPPSRAHVQHASVCSFKTLSCEATRRPHVQIHAGVLRLHTEAF